jgi:UDP-N-acetyl-D-glucosamine/UDP-N-acetyl-D-galactosamine dehydrogenase
VLTARARSGTSCLHAGLVGGHCIGVDPYYLAYKAQQFGHNPEVILAGRRTNDGMGDYIAGQVDGALGKPSSSVLVLGLTFKENIPDLRNSKVVANTASRSPAIWRSSRVSMRCSAP